MERSVKIRAINQYANGERFLHATNDDRNGKQRPWGR
jgi:hypothetical protein